MTDFDKATHWAPGECWNCGYEFDAHTEIVGSDRTGAPGEGDFSLCLACGMICIFSAELATRMPSEAELDEFEQDADFRRTWAQLMWGRQRVAVKRPWEDRH